MSRIKSITRNLYFVLTQDLIGLIRQVERQLTERTDRLDKSLDSRFQEREKHSDQRAGQHEAAIDRRNEERLATVERRIDERADERLIKVDRRADERLDALEKRADERMERHERKIDGMIRQMSNEILERNDLMLQLFEQRLDKLRREVQSLREGKTLRPAVETPRPEPAAVNEDEIEKPATNGSGSHKQLISFRKQADLATSVKSKVGSASQTALYHQILAWKKVAEMGLQDFTQDEQEIVDYILSFINDPKELHYVQQHLRRFISTMQRIPPAQRSTDRLLELGSLSHLAPAVSKFCGYREIQCADFWESPEKVTHHTIKQQRGPDQYKFELQNFNVERDPFPYADGQFRVALCCELIEHLQSDPMHMLWECNRVLEHDGYLVLTTPNIASARAIEGLLVGCAPYLLAQYNVRVAADQHHREYAPFEVGVALAAAGFTVLELQTEDVWTRSNPAILDLLKRVEISTELRGDNIFALARKTGAPIERYPKELYIN